MSDNLPERSDPQLPDTWEFSNTAQKGLEIAREQLRSKHGLYAGIPIVCKGPECPYAETCILQQNRMAPIGERCPIEIAQITEKFQAYCRQLGIEPENIVDLGLLKDLIDAEVMIDRCDRLLADEGDMLTKSVVGVSDKGKPYYKDEVHKALEIKERQQKRKNDILQLLNSTRKDQSREQTALLDHSQYATKLYKKFMEDSQNVIDAEVVDIDEILKEDDDEETN